MVYNSIEIEPSQEPSPEKPSAETIVATNYFFQSNEVLVRECAQDRQTFKSSCFTDFDRTWTDSVLTWTMTEKSPIRV